MKRMLDKKDSRMPGGRAGCESVAASHRWRQQGIHSGGLFQIWAVFRVDRRCVAQEAPVDVWPQVFAADESAGGALDGRAANGRYRPFELYPLIDGRCSNTDQSSQSGLTTDNGARFFDWMAIHDANDKATPYDVSIGIA